MRYYAAGLIVLVLLNSAYVVTSMLDRRGRDLQVVRYEGVHVQSNDDLDGRLSAFYWLRENSPPDSIVVLPFEFTARASLFHERLNYVTAAQYYFGDNIPAYDSRGIDLRILFDPSTPPDDFRNVLQSMESELPGAQFYAVAKYLETDPALMRERGAKAVFDSPDDMVAVYLLNPP